jgi:predicted nucleic acid-binding protein
MEEMRESLEKAFETAPEKEPVATSEAAPAREPEPESVPATEDKGPAESKVDASPDKPADKVVVEEKQEIKETPVEPEKVAEPKIKAPVSWKAGAKERWSTLPSEVQEEVVRRERESAVAIQQGAEGRKFTEAFQQAIAPYQAVMAAEGTTDPIHAVRNLMQTAAVLRLGTPVQKADLVARLIKVYGVDVPTLDSMLSGQDDPAIKQQTQFDQMLNERLTPLQQKLAQYEEMLGNQQQRVQQDAAKAVEDFASKNEFVDDPDIANDMADLLEMAAKRGRNLSMQDAYDRAVASHPTISKIVAQRKAAQKPAIDVQKIKDASSSVKGSPMGGGPPLAPEDIRGHIMAAMDR